MAYGVTMGTKRSDRGFARLQLKDWRQFSEIDIRFHPRLTVLTGANASGKTTLLNLLSQHFNWFIQYLGVPVRSSSLSQQWQVDLHDTDQTTTTIGQLAYTDGPTSPILVHGGAGYPTYHLEIRDQKLVPGIFISSHRALSEYQPLQSLPSHFSSSEMLLDQFVSEVRNRLTGYQSGRTPLYQMKEALVAAAVFGEGGRAVERNAEAAATWDGFQEVLSSLLPKSLGFKGLRVRAPEVLIVSEGGEFLIDAVSGGVSAIMELAWQIFLTSRNHSAFTVCIDEPENHLHPSLQRSLIPSLLAAFPGLSFIVATHSPFIVTAVPDSAVYVLDYEEDAVFSRLLDMVSKSTTSDETLRRVLGMDTTAPLWVEKAVDAIIESFPVEALSPGDLRRLRDQLHEIGLADQFPAAIAALVPDAPDAQTE
jgi:hypothetical protein